MPSLSGGTTYLTGAVVIENDALTGTAASLTIGSGSTAGGVLNGSATLNFPSIAANTTADLTITVTGAATDDIAVSSAPAALTSGLTHCAFVSAANTVTVRLANSTVGAIDPASATFKVRVFK